MSLDKQLQVFRDQIDKIDSEIVDLIKKRMSIVKEVGLYKESVADKFFVKSAREADMLRDLTKNLEGVVDKMVVYNIWRSLIVSANIAEQDLEVFLYNPQKNHILMPILSGYYANLVNIVEINDIEQFFSLENSQNARILAVDTRQNGDLWQKILDNDEKLKIFAKVTQKDNSLYLLANKPIERSKKDNFVYLLGEKLEETEIKNESTGFLGLFGVVDK